MFIISNPGPPSPLTLRFEMREHDLLQVFTGLWWGEGVNFFFFKCLCTICIPGLLGSVLSVT